MRQGASQENSNVPSSPLVAVSRALNPVKRSNAVEQALAQRVREKKTVVFISSGQPKGGWIFQEIADAKTVRRPEFVTMIPGIPHADRQAQH